MIDWQSRPRPNDRRPGGDQPQMVQERTTEDGLVEVVGEGVLGGQLRHGERRGRVVALGQAPRIARPREQVVLAAVDLHLVLVEAVDEVLARLVDRDVLGDVERRVREAVRTVRRQEVRIVLRQTVVRRACAAIHLGLGRARCGRDPVRSRELSVQIVEAVVLEVDDHEVVDVPQGTWMGSARRRG